MAEIDVTCPQCGNRRGVPADLAGKKIKCKKCQSIFTVKAPPAAAKPAGGPAPKPAAKKPDPPIPFKSETKTAAQLKKEDDDEVIDGKNPYIMREENLAARCPFCAQLMEPPDAQICIHCGYDLRRRKRVETKKTYELTAADYILWHLPTVATFVGISIAIAIAVFLFMNFDEWLDKSDLEAVVPSSCFQVWTVIFTLIPMWFGGRFIFRRLVWYFHPPEKVKKIKEEED